MSSNVTSEEPHVLRNAFKIDEGEVSAHVDEVVRRSVEETMNGLLEAAAEAICRAQRYERSAERQDTRAGRYRRELATIRGSYIGTILKSRSGHPADGLLYADSGFQSRRYPGRRFALPWVFVLSPPGTGQRDST